MSDRQAEASGRRNSPGISDRKAAMLHRAMTNSTVDAIGFMRSDLVIEDVSRSFARLFGRAQADLLGQPITTILEGDIDVCLQLTGKSREEYLPDRMHQMVGISPDGHRFPIRVRLIPLDGADGKYWFLIVTDLARENELDRLKSDFVANVSHELRIPLASIAGALGLVAGGATGELEADAAEMVDVALNNTHRLIRLINDLLDIERIGAGKLHFQMRAQSLRTIVKSAVKELAPFAADHAITLEVEDRPGADCVWVDSDRMLQVLTNLLSNAVKFSSNGGVVRIILQPDDAFHRIDVVDNGAGIPESFRPHVFDKFAQADSIATRRAGGTGLGLAISREIVSRLDGKLWFAANPEGGTIFSVEIPTCLANQTASP